MVMPAKTICAILFAKQDDGTYLCTTCKKTYRSVHGYTNLLNHLKRNHPSYEQDAQESSRRNNALQLSVVDVRTRDIYRWIDWVIMDRLPFAFVEHPRVRANTSLSPISVDTLKVYIERVFQATEQRIATTLLASFGIVLDGWSDCGRHYLAIFAVFDNGTQTGVPSHDTYFDDLDCSSREHVLLAFCPVEEEEDLSAQSIFDLIADTLSRYNKPWEAVTFMVGDNCSVNQYIGRREGAIPLIGCASHRFNLAVKDFIKADEPLIAKVHALMTKLRTIKGRALLRRVSDKAPLVRNDTRWSSTFAMLTRYVDLEPALTSLGHRTLVEFDVHPLLLRRSESERVNSLVADLSNLENVTKALQKATLTLSGARRLFDHVIKTYPQLKSRLCPSAAIINYPDLESGIVKLQRRAALTISERAACLRFKRAVEPPRQRVQQEATFVMSAFTKAKVVKPSQYIDTAFVPPTSNECERFFSSVKLVFTNLRNSLDVVSLEMVMYLMYNRTHWDVHTVDQAHTRNARA